MFSGSRRRSAFEDCRFGAPVPIGGVWPRVRTRPSVRMIRRTRASSSRTGRSRGCAGTWRRSTATGIAGSATVNGSSNNYPLSRRHVATQSWTAWVAAPRAVSSTASPTRPPCEVLRPSRPAAAQAAAKPAVHLVDTETDDGIAKFRRGRRCRRRDRGRAAADQAPDVGMISGLIRLRAADGDDVVVTVRELDVGPAQSRHLAAAQRPVKEQRHDHGVDDAAARSRCCAAARRWRALRLGG